MTSANMNDPIDAIGEVMPKLLKAQQAYEDAVQNESLAKTNTTSMLNNLSAKQKEFDDLVSDLRAAGSGDWKLPRQRGGYDNDQ